MCGRARATRTMGGQYNALATLRHLGRRVSGSAHTAVTSFNSMISVKGRFLNIIVITIVVVIVGGAATDAFRCLSLRQ